MGSGEGMGPSQMNHTPAPSRRRVPVPAGRSSIALEAGGRRPARDAHATGVGPKHESETGGRGAHAILMQGSGYVPAGGSEFDSDRDGVLSELREKLLMVIEAARNVEAARGIVPDLSTFAPDLAREKHRKERLRLSGRAVGESNADYAAGEAMTQWLWWRKVFRRDLFRLADRTRTWAARALLAESAKRGRSSWANYGAVDVLLEAAGVSPDASTMAAYYRGVGPHQDVSSDAAGVWPDANALATYHRDTGIVPVPGADPPERVDFARASSPAMGSDGGLGMSVEEWDTDGMAMSYRGAVFGAGTGARAPPRPEGGAWLDVAGEELEDSSTDPLSDQE